MTASSMRIQGNRRSWECHGTLLSAGIFFGRSASSSSWWASSTARWPKQKKLNAKDSATPSIHPLGGDRQLHSVPQQASEALSRLSFARQRPEQHLASARLGVKVQPQQQHCLGGWARFCALRRRASAARRSRRSQAWINAASWSMSKVPSRLSLSD